jgi:hypothetical protein
MAARIPSFTHLLSSYDPSMLPLANLGPLAGSDAAADVIKNLPHATTIVAVACEGGVVMAGDRGQHDLQAGRGQGVPRRR